MAVQLQSEHFESKPRCCLLDGNGFGLDTQRDDVKVSIPKVITFRLVNCGILGPRRLDTDLQGLLPLVTSGL